MEEKTTFVTNQQIAAFRDIGSQFLRHANNKSKLEYAVKKMVEKLKTDHEKYLDESQDLREELACVNQESKAKEIIRDEKGNMTYTPDASKKLRKRLRELQNKEVSVDPHYIDSPELPDDLSFQISTGDGEGMTVTDYDVREAFTNIVIRKQE